MLRRYDSKVEKSYMLKKVLPHSDSVVLLPFALGGIVMWILLLPFSLALWM